MDDHQPEQVQPTFFELAQGLQAMGVQVRAMQEQMQPMTAEMASLQSQLENPMPHQNMAELENQYGVVYSAFKQLYLSYLSRLQQMRQLQAYLIEHYPQNADRQ